MESSNDNNSKQAALEKLQCLQVYIAADGNACFHTSDVYKAIDGLENTQPEYCKDAVSRQLLLNGLANMMDTEGFRDGWAVSRANVENMIKAAAPVCVPVAWTPVHKDLPKESGLYYVTERTHDGEYETKTRYYNYYLEGGSCWSGHHPEAVIAWQPRPEPYVPEDNACQDEE